MIIPTTDTKPNIKKPQKLAFLEVKKTDIDFSIYKDSVNAVLNRPQFFRISAQLMS
jgi:hypothetical protein